MTSSRTKPWIFTSRTMNSLGTVTAELIEYAKEEMSIQLRLTSLLNAKYDSDEFKDLYAAANRSWLGSGVVEGDIMSATFPAGGILEGISVMNQQSGQIYGILIVSPFSARRGSLELTTFATVQRTGLPVGSILLAELIHLIFFSGEFDNQFKQIELKTNIDSRSARMYERMGFIKKNDAMILYKDVITNDILRKLVTDRSFTNIQPRQLEWRRRRNTPEEL